MVWQAVFDNGQRERVWGLNVYHAAQRLARLVFGDWAVAVPWCVDERTGTGGLFQIVSRKSGRVLAVVDITREGNHARGEPARVG
ncbi:MAG: hypothetical protein QXX12_01675 [Nanopusillaceae archaeon]